MRCCRRRAPRSRPAPRTLKAVARRDPGCCQAEYLDQPVRPYTVDELLDDGQVIRLGDADWQVVRTPGHPPGHLSLWQPEDRPLVVRDALSDYDVGWVNIAAGPAQPPPPWFPCAGWLFISRKAVEYHLGNIYAKCGLQGRQQLRRFVGQWRQPVAV